MSTKEKTRLPRLLAILTLLQSKSLVTAREIANKYNISLRTVYRDIRTLESSGVPIVTEEGKGYTLLTGYKMPPVSFTEKEALSLVTAEQLIIKNKDKSLISHYREAMMKIRAILRYNNKEKTELLSNRIVFKNNSINEKTSNLVPDLQIAITSFKLLEITYHSLAHETTKRKIEPFAIYSTQDNWLLIAFCRLRNSFRKFRVDCIQQIIFQEEVFPSHNMTLQEYFNNYG